ncbi:hypothetical protein G6F46_013732 [Rhizopus delemar]|nr:hypothetical protein G6F46_013732 [Rhizopus delemar]
MGIHPSHDPVIAKAIAGAAGESGDHPCRNAGIAHQHHECGTEVLAEAGLVAEQELVDRVAPGLGRFQRVGEIGGDPLQRAADDGRVIVACVMPPLACQGGGAWIEAIGQLQRRAPQIRRQGAGEAPWWRRLQPPAAERGQRSIAAQAHSQCCVPASTTAGGRRALAGSRIQRRPSNAGSTGPRQ